MGIESPEIRVSTLPVCFLLLLASAVKAALAAGPHPLDPLNASEIKAAADACKQFAQQQGIEEIRFNVITLKEPLKAALIAFEAGSGPCPARQAFAILQVCGALWGVQGEG
jgi:primary-amine oxidase